MGEQTRITHGFPRFDRNFWDGTFRFTQIGGGSIGGKASGLAFIHEMLERLELPGGLRSIAIDVPTLAVIATDFFDEFMQHNKLHELAFGEMSDTRIGLAFQKADLPVELLGDLRALVMQVRTPLAVRSSSLLEDALGRPFAGVYATKMLPNNQPDADSRFRRLTEAVKFVYASTFFREAREYIRTTGRDPRDEKMAVILQEVVGLRHGDRFYPHICGVARSVNFYPNAPARPEDGVVSLALGMGKTIVDGGLCWAYSPAFPKNPPPFGSIDELLHGTQTKFWSVNMGKPPAYDPVNEVEYMQLDDLSVAEQDGVLDLLVSTYDGSRGRLTPGAWSKGARILNFAPQLVLEQFPLNALVSFVLRSAEDASDAKVEIEFALTYEKQSDGPLKARFGFLQVRPLVISELVVEVSSEDLSDTKAIVASERVLGNCMEQDIRDIVYVRPESFSTEHTAQIAAEIGDLNRELSASQTSYILIGFGRWGSSHSSLGIPVDWSQISGARAIVEATLPGINVELSQGSHFFHNLSSFRATYFMVRFDGKYPIDWAWLNAQPVCRETEFVRHVRTKHSIQVRVDGRTGRGVISAATAGNE
jgi:Pyruvate phosphate dikinase, AMP/ATP-binding domain